MTEPVSLVNTVANEHLNKARQFLADAQYLLADKRYDSAVSRCYYALYHYAIGYLEQQGNKRPAWNHGTLRKMVQQKNVSFKKVNLYDTLFDAYELRTIADYKHGETGSKDSAELMKRTLIIFSKKEHAL